MLACTVDSPGFGPVRVINLHATAGGAYRRKRRLGAPDRRSAQIAQAIEFACRPFDGTVVLAGDFNCDPAADPTADGLLREASFRDVAAGLPDDARPQGTWDPANPLNQGRAGGPARRVDHIFLRSGSGRGVTVSSVRTVLDKPLVPLPDGEPLPLSDHYGLLAELATS